MKTRMLGLVQCICRVSLLRQEYAGGLRQRGMKPLSEATRDLAFIFLQIYRLNALH